MGRREGLDGGGRGETGRMSEQWTHTMGESNQGLRTTEGVKGEAVKKEEGQRDGRGMERSEAGSGMRADG